MLRIVIIIFVVFLASCGGKNDNHQPVVIDLNKSKEPLIKVNQKISKDEKRAIDAYVTRRNWNMIETGTGVKYMIYERGKDKMPESGDIVVIDFEIQLLDGSVCYSSKESGPEHFVVEYDHVESGMHEAIQYLHEGDKAMIIIPSHRAFGLAGDNEKIPSFATVVYNIHLLKIISKSVER